MNLRHVKRIAHRRLAYLIARIETSPNGSKEILEERDALDTMMRCLDLLDVEMLAACLANCRARVLPAADRTFARARRGDELLTKTHELVDAIYGQVRG